MCRTPSKPSVAVPDWSARTTTWPISAGRELLAKVDLWQAEAQTDERADADPRLQSRGNGRRDTSTCCTRRAWRGGRSSPACNSLREVEPTVKLIMDDGRLDDETGDDRRGGPGMSADSAIKVRGRRTAAQPGADDLRHRLARRPAQPVGHGHGAGRLADARTPRRSARSGCCCRCRKSLGQQVKKLYTPPQAPGIRGTQTNWFDERPGRRAGGPVPPLDGLPEVPPPGPAEFRAVRAEGRRRTGPTGPASSTQTARRRASRPWRSRPASWSPAHTATSTTSPGSEFVHRGDTDCRYRLRLYEVGASGEAADVEVMCASAEGPPPHGRGVRAGQRSQHAGLPGASAPPAGLRPKGCDVPHVTADAARGSRIPGSP